MQAYTTWHVMRRLRPSAATNARHAPAPPTPAGTIRAAADFIAWLARQRLGDAS